MRWTIIATVLAFYCLACSKTDNDDEVGGGGGMNDFSIVISSSKDSTGIGDNDGIPAGVNFNLPSRIELVRRPNLAFDSSLDKLKGHMNTFYTDLHFVNHSPCDTAPIVIKLPKGLIFTSRSGGRMQHGMLISEVVITIPPGGCSDRKDTVTAYIGLACLNKNKGLPWEENDKPDTKDFPIGKDMHSLAMVTTDKNLLELLSLFENKPGLRLTRHFNPFDAFEEDYVMPEWLEIYSEIQDAIWAITDGPGLLKKDFEELKRKLKNYE